jgi:hypothetical protein
VILTKSFSRKVFVLPGLDPAGIKSGSLLSATPSQSGHSIDNVVWGLEQTSHFLFTSSRCLGYDDDDDMRGFHVAFDVRRSKLVYKFDAKDSGQASALSSNGKGIVVRCHHFICSLSA